MNRLGVIAVGLASVALLGCGTGIATDFPNRVAGADGQHFVLEDLQQIADDPRLGQEEKRQRFRDLGIEDEKLIEALLSL